MTTHARRFITLSLVLAALILMAGCSHGTEDGESPYVATPEEVPSEDSTPYDQNTGSNDPAQDHDELLARTIG